MNRGSLILHPQMCLNDALSVHTAVVQNGRDVQVLVWILESVARMRMILIRMQRLHADVVRLRCLSAESTNAASCPRCTCTVLINVLTRRVALKLILALHGTLPKSSETLFEVTEHRAWTLTVFSYEQIFSCKSFTTFLPIEVRQHI